MSALEKTEFVERREAPRHTLVMRTAKLVSRHGEFACIVRDVSASGAKLRLFHKPPPDEFLFLELANGEIYAIQHIWTEGEYCGYRFASEIDVDAFIKEPGKHPGRPVRLNITRPMLVHAAGHEYRAILVNLSQEGACFECDQPFAETQRINVEIEFVPGRIGHVCWRKGQAHGVVFQEGFALDEFARIALLLQPFPEDTGTFDQGKLRCA